MKIEQIIKEVVINEISVTMEAEKSLRQLFLRNNNKYLLKDLMKLINGAWAKNNGGKMAIDFILKKWKNLGKLELVNNYLIYS